MVARLKLKGIDGGSHKRWSMCLIRGYAKNLILGLTCPKGVGSKGAETSPQRYPVRSLPQVLHGCRQLVS